MKFGFYSFCVLKVTLLLQSHMEHQMIHVVSEMYSLEFGFVIFDEEAKKSLIKAAHN